MPHLSLSLLGPFQLTLAGQPVTEFKSNKVRALLAYLAVEADRPHRRELLAGLLWPDWPDREALSNLRYALSDLRRVIGDRTADPPFLLIARDTLQFNTASDYHLDVTAFTELVEVDKSHPPAVEPLQQAVALYQGSFLEGFSISDSPAFFEEWTLFTRERLARRMSTALHQLASTYEQRGEYEQAQTWARRQIELEPWDEAAHQQLMRLLALSGQRSAALAQYESCRRLLAEELAVEPGEETTRLYEQIRTGKLKAPGSSGAARPDLTASLPRFLEEEPPHLDLPVFVARERELAQLDAFLELALAGQGRVAFVTGEAGSGKTALMQEFTRRAQEAQPDLIVAGGNCNAFTGIGDPYLPFREILELLSGNVEAKWAAGAMTREYARRLWQTLPVAAQALVETGPDLIDTFLPRAALLDRALNFTPGSGQTNWLTWLNELVERKPPISSSALSLPQSDLFEQYTRVLQAVAQRGPLLLVVDDLQWADLGSISLLFHLGRHVAGSRLLIVGAYRPEEVTIGKDGVRHPLQPVVNEFQRVFGDISVNLGQAEGRDFVEALLDSEPNRLGDAFREMLYRQTYGQPLFTVELLRGLQERGDLTQDPEGRWFAGAALDWKRLPARVEAVIAERIGRLAQPLQAALRVASVEGELFTAEVVARVRATDEREMLERLSRELDRRHGLVQVEAIERLGLQRVSRYRFRHYLCQKYLYDSLDEGERAYLHEDVGTVLEALYGDRANEISMRLARHFQEAGLTEKAIHYLHQAGQRALELSAYQEATAHLSRGLALLMTLPASARRDQQELTLQLALGVAWQGSRGTQSAEMKEAYLRARELVPPAEQAARLCQVLGELAVHHFVRAEHQTARELGEKALSLAQQSEDPLVVALGHWYVGLSLFCLGEYPTAQAHFEHVIGFYDPEQHKHAFVHLRGSDIGVSALAYAACCLWGLGYPEQAAQQSETALSLAREQDHPFSLADVLCYGGCLFSAMRRDAQALKEYAEELMRLSSAKVPVWLPEGTCYRGEALARLGRVQEGIVQLRAGMTDLLSIDTRCCMTQRLCALAEAQARGGQLQEGLATLAEAFAFVEETGERHWEAELYRLKAGLLLAQGDEVEAEASLHQAIEVARRQSARSWELRATMELSRLWQSQGKQAEAYQLLAEIYHWFSEGYNTSDLQEARALLEELA